MIKLSSRMKAIADQIVPGQRVADIGTDHANIPIYLFQKKISTKIILTDSKDGPLLKAKSNLESHGLLDVLTDIRKGNGLAVLNSKEVDAVIIAGMGGLLIIEILAADLKKSMSFSQFVLQPRSAAAELRAWLAANHFSIVGEHLAEEGNRICEILTVRPAFSHLDAESFSEEIDFEIPPLLLAARDPLFDAFLNAKILHVEAILDTLANVNTPPAQKRKLILENHLKALKERKTLL